MIFEGTIYVPPSKSYTQRAFATSLIIDEVEISHLGESNDEKQVKQIIESLGNHITKVSHNSVLIRKKVDWNQELIIDCGESGLCARLFGSLLLLNSKKVKIIGRDTLLQRPMSELIEIYSKLNIEYRSNGHLPIEFIPNKSTINLKLDASTSSQHITGLLYYLVGLNLSHKTSIQLLNPNSKPYIDLTIEILRIAGACIEITSDYSTIVIHPSKLKSKVAFHIESDWSSASYWIVAATISGNITLQGLNISSKQADKQILEIVKMVGAKINIDSEFVNIQSDRIEAFHFDATNCPDLIPILSVLALFCKGESRILGGHRLIHKESNRLEGILSQLIKLNSSVHYDDTAIVIFGNSWNELPEKISLDTFSDHRLVMAWTILICALKKMPDLNNIESVNKSYPNFFNHLSTLT